MDRWAFSELVSGETGPRSPRVFVIDDNAQMRLIIGAILKEAGVRAVFFAQDGEMGLTMVDRCAPDVVVVDLQMPQMNGFAFVAHLRARRTPDRKLPVIMLTGHCEPARLFQARDRGVTDFLAKPISPTVLLQRLRHVLARPRPFIEVDAYVGPERRRRASNAYTGPWRRGGEPEGGGARSCARAAEA